MQMFFHNPLSFKKEAKTVKWLILSFMLLMNLSHGRNNKIGAIFNHSDVFKWDGCEDVKPSDFKEVKLITFGDHQLKQPSKVAFVKTSDVPNFYFTEKITGRIAYYDDATKMVTEVGSVKHELHTAGYEDGLNGIAFNWDFETTKWVYLSYSVKGFYRVARYRISPDNKLMVNTQQNILDIPKWDGQWHASGAIDFDAYGDLWMAVGDNLYGYFSPGVKKGYGDERCDHYVSMGTANMLGSWLRIHPTEEKQSNGKYYTIPKNNFGEYWAKKFEEEGRTELAKDYRDPKVVLPEIFAKGIRNSWTLKVVEPFRRFAASGECGPDHPKSTDYTEETNIANTPKFFGWPIQAGATSTLPFKGRHLSSLPGGTIYDRDAPGIGTNTKIKGAKVLPPLQDPVYHWEYSGRSCGTGAEMYWYDGHSKSTRKFPPHFNGRLFATDHDTQWIRIVTLNDALDKTLSESEFFAPNKQINTEKPLDVKFGPDGALYVIHWIGTWFKNNAAQNISRIEYTGNCHPVTPVTAERACNPADPTDFSKKCGCPENRNCEGAVSIHKVDENKLFDVGPQEISITEKGRHSMRVHNVSGRLIVSEAGRGPRQYNFSHLQRGLYFITVEAGERKYTRRILVNY